MALQLPTNRGVTSPHPLANGPVGVSSSVKILNQATMGFGKMMVGHREAPVGFGLSNLNPT